ncbi:hypothetical protein FB451DRAFT_58410 [Mycena latifolia]|nr:hypothetical protein FB451DRAFT_58410 [Mycena latifolia]
MRFKFNPPTYAGYSFIDAQISSCVQTESAADPSTFPEGTNLCGAILDCVFDNTSNRVMAFYAAGATILGFMPTILSMVGTSRDDHLKIHKRFPILAFLLSCCNPSTAISGLVWRTDTPPEDVLLKNYVRVEGSRGKFIVPVMHGVAAAAAGVVMWQAVILGMRGVVSFSCPTWENPLIWVLLGPAGHLIDVVVSRWCIEGRDRWSWNLQGANRVKIRWPWVMRGKDMFLTILALADYVYGTVILSAMQLVAPRPALEISVFFAIPAISARLISLVILELRPRDDENLRDKPSGDRPGIPMALRRGDSSIDESSVGTAAEGRELLYSPQHEAFKSSKKTWPRREDSAP